MKFIFVIASLALSTSAYADEPVLTGIAVTAGGIVTSAVGEGIAHKGKIQAIEAEKLGDPIKIRAGTIQDVQAATGKRPMNLLLQQKRDVVKRQQLLKTSGRRIAGGRAMMVGGMVASSLGTFYTIGSALADRPPTNEPIVRYHDEDVLEPDPEPTTDAPLD